MLSELLMKGVLTMTIKEARIKAGLTQAAMSDMLSIPKRTIEDWERNKSKPPAWAERLIIERLSLPTNKDNKIIELTGAEMEDQNYFVKRYIDICKQFSRDTADLPRLNRNQDYIIRRGTWRAVAFSDEISVSWAFHQSDSYIEYYASQILFEQLLHDLEHMLFDVIYDETYDDFDQDLQSVLEKYENI